MAPPSVGKRRHPLKMPLRKWKSPESDDSTTICRFHNYDPKGCRKHQDPSTTCPLDHEHCHICLRAGHKALDCEVYQDPELWTKFNATFTLANTRPEDYEQKTVLGDKIVWIDDLLRRDPTLANELPPGFRMEDSQLRRCRKHKKVEAQFLLSLPVLRQQQSCSFVDVGAHFGDTVLTMALHARAQGRTDIRFFAFEPSAIKCTWIKRLAEANNVIVEIFNVAVGSSCAVVVQDDGRNPRGLLDGSLAYLPCSSKDQNEPPHEIIKMVSLDSMASLLSPLGLLHVDTEGTEPSVLQGARGLLEAAPDGAIVIAELWSDDDCRRRGVDKGSEGRLLAAMGDHSTFERLDDIVDLERNAVFRKCTEHI